MDLNSDTKDNESPELAKCIEKLRKLQNELQELGIRHAHIFTDKTRGNNTLRSDVNVIIDIDYEKSNIDAVNIIGIEDKVTQKFRLGRRVGVISLGGLKVPKHDYIRDGMKQVF